MKRTWIAGLVLALLTALGVMALAPTASADSYVPLGTFGAIKYGSKATWYSGCWSRGSKATLQVKQGDRWETVAKGKPLRGYKDYDRRFTEKKLVCPKRAYPLIMRYTFRATFEGKMMTAGEYEGRERVRMREVYKSRGKTRYEYWTIWII